jgi:two-component system, NarL family, sensor histidine kinase UhpB
MPANNLDVLLVEDNPTDLVILKKMLGDSALPISHLYSTDRITEAQKLLETRQLHLALLDLSLPDSFGIDTYLGIKRVTDNIPVIILTGTNDSGVALEALKQGAQDYLVKGEFNGDLLTRSINYSLQRKNSEEALRISEEKYRNTFYQSPLPTWIYDRNSLEFLEVNDAAVKMYGYTRKEFLRLTLKDIRPKEEISRLLHSLNKPEAGHKLWKHLKKNGDILMVEVTHYPVNYHGRVAHQAQIHDVTEEIDLRNKLEEQQKAEQKNITAAVLEALEHERGYIGEELHDNINQILAACKLYLEYIKSNDQDKFLIDKCLDTTKLAIEEIRKLSRNLIVSDIKERGLHSSIEQLISTIQEVKPIHIELNFDLPQTDLDEKMQINIYRIIQEQLNNIIKHADASGIRISLSGNDGQIRLDIRDDGKGFDPSVARKGVGFTNMISRVRLYDGQLNFDSAPGKGCHLSVVLNKNA